MIEIDVDEEGCVCVTPSWTEWIPLVITGCVLSLIVVVATHHLLRSQGLL